MTHIMTDPFWDDEKKCIRTGFDSEEEMVTFVKKRPGAIKRAHSVPTKKIDRDEQSES